MNDYELLKSKTRKICLNNFPILNKYLKDKFNNTINISLVFHKTKIFYSISERDIKCLNRVCFEKLIYRSIFKT